MLALHRENRNISDVKESSLASLHKYICTQIFLEFAVVLYGGKNIKRHKS
jgi:hypothetical protein